MKPARSALALTVAGLLALSACSGGGNPTTSAPAPGGSATPEPVTIQVSMDAGLEADAVKVLDDRIAQFTADNPNITLEKQEFTWDATTFAPQLAGGTLPDVFPIPFTDGRGLIERGQIANVSQYVAQYDWAGQLNPKVAQAGQAADGSQWAVPIAAYGQGLHYNRTLFKQAGLDPDKPPTTWAEIREAAKKISDATGMAGYTQMTQSNTGGWILTTTAYAMGGRIVELDAAGTPVVTVNAPATKAALQYLHDLRWADDSMGADFLYDWAKINQDFAVGKIGMYISGGGNYGNLVTQNAMKAEDYGLTVVPLEGADAGALGGGTLVAVNVKASPAEQEAAVKWLDFYYISKLTDQEQAVLDAKTSAAQDSPVGSPQLPIFDQATYAKQQGWIKEFVNVPLDQMRHYSENIFSQPLLPEPAVATQEVYATLDPVVQTVLTDKDANIDQLLADAQKAVEALVNS